MPRLLSLVLAVVFLGCPPPPELHFTAAELSGFEATTTYDAAMTYIEAQLDLTSLYNELHLTSFGEAVEGLRLPPYHLEKVGVQYELTFEGKWPEVMLWEIPALAVLMELRGRAVLGTMRRFELQVLYARAMT